MWSCDFRQTVAVALILLTALVTMPVSAADFSTSKSVIGSVSAVGPVELRGVGISQEGTLFAGDSIRSGQKGYAKILLGTGNKIELAEKTEVNINRDAQGVKIAMNTGTVGFTALSPLRIDMLPFEVSATDGAAGNVAIMSSATAGVRAVSGKVTVRNLKTSESFVLTKGQEQLFGLKDGAHAPPLAQIASNMPGPIPAPRPQTPAGKTGGGLAMDTGAWLAVIGGAAIAGVAVWGLVVAMNNHDDVKDLKNTINNLNNTITTNNTQVKNVASGAAISATVSSIQAQQNQAAVLAAQAQLALTAAGNATAAAQAASLATQANANQTALSALQTQIQTLQAQFAAGGGSTAQLNTLLQQEETLRIAGNNLATQLNSLLAANRNTPGVPSATVGTVSGPVVPSASLPV